MSRQRQGRRTALQGGRRRRRAGARVALALLLVVPLALIAFAYVTYVRDESPSRHSTTVDGSGVGDKPEAGGSLEPRSPAPIQLSGVDAFRLRFRHPPRAALVFDLDNGKVLYRLSPLKTLPIASLTKIMTALLVTRQAKPGEPVRITKDALNYQGSGMGVLPKGKRVRLETLLNGLLLVSGNDAAIALADHVSGSQKRFVGLMNEQARLWGLSCTHYASPHGLENGNRSCAADLAVLARLAMRVPRIERVVGRQQASFKFPIKGGKLFLAGHNPLMLADYPGTIGLKTGYTDPAGRCYVGVVKRHGRKLGVVLLHSPDPAKQAEKLLDLAFRAKE